MNLSYAQGYGFALALDAQGELPMNAPRMLGGKTPDQMDALAAKLGSRGEALVAKGRGSSSSAGRLGGASASYYKGESLRLASYYLRETAKLLRSGDNEGANSAFRTAKVQADYAGVSL